MTAFVRAAAPRVLAFVATLAGAVGLMLLMMVLAPGDPVDLIPNGNELRPELEARWGLDQPLVVRYWRYLRNVLTLDLGTSLTYRPGQPVWEVIVSPALGTLGRLAASVFCATVAGLGLAWITAGRRTPVRWVVYAVSITPVFLLAHGLVTGLNEATFALLEAGQIERPSWFALPDQPSSLRSALAITILAFGSGALAQSHSQIEDALVRIRSSSYVDALRARGASTWPSVLANLAVPLAATVAERAAFLAGGVVVIEKVLLLNGVGAILWRAAELRDYDLALAVALLAALFVGVVRLVADTVRVAIDPRLRLPR